MLYTKRALYNKQSLGSASKSRSKSIHRPEHSHALSMHPKLEQEPSPDRLRHPDPTFKHKQSCKENRVQDFREFVKLVEDAKDGKRTHRGDLASRSQSKLINAQVMETDRLVSRSNAITSYPSQAEIVLKQRALNQQEKQSDRVAITETDLKAILAEYRKLDKSNQMLKKQLSFLKKSKPGNIVARALLN